MIVIKFATKHFQKSPNLVTLVGCLVNNLVSDLDLDHLGDGLPSDEPIPPSAGRDVATVSRVEAFDRQFDLFLVQRRRRRCAVVVGRRVVKARRQRC